MKTLIAAIFAGTMLSSGALAQNYSAQNFSSLTLGTPLAVTSGGLGNATGAVDGLTVLGRTLANTLGPGGVTASMLASGATAANLGYAPLNPANNFSELSNAATARANLDLGLLATQSSVTGTLLASGAAAANLGFTPLNPANNLSEVTNSASARTNLGIGPLQSGYTSATGLGSAANYAVGTSGASLGLFNTQNSWSPPVPPWTTFTTLYQGDLYNLGGLPAGSMDAHNAGAVAMTEALVGAVDVPVGAVNATFINAGVAGYSRSATPAAAAVGVFGGAMANVAGASTWGLNTIATNTTQIVPATQTGLNGVTAYSIEADLNIMKLPGGGTPTGTVRGLAIFSGSEVHPSGGAYGIEVGPFGQGSFGNTIWWDSAIVIDGAPNTTAIQIGAKGAGTTSLPSQSIAFNSYNSSSTLLTSTIGADPNGNLQITPGAGGATNIVGTVTEGPLSVTNTVQYGGITLSTGSNFTGVLAGFGTGGDGGTLELLTGGTIKTLLSGNTGTGSYINNAAGLTVGGTGTAAAGVINATGGFQVNGVGQNAAGGLASVTGATTSGNLPSFSSANGPLQDSGIVASSIVTLTGAQTLTNKTLNNPSITSPTVTGSLSSGPVSVTSGSIYSGLTLSTGSNFSAILDGYGVGNDGGTLSLQTGCALKTLLSGNTGTGSYINNGAGLTVGGTGTAPAGAVQASSEVNGVTGHLAASGTAPTVTSGFGSSTGSIGTVNGTWHFDVNTNVGGTSGVVGLPTATTAWNCFANSKNNPTTIAVHQTGFGTASATFAPYTLSGVLSAWVASDVISISCFAN